MCRGQNARTIYATKSTSNHFRAAHGKQSSFFYSFFLSHSAIYKKKNLVVRTLTWHPSRIDCNGWAMHTCDTCDATFICANPCSAHASGLQAFFTSIIFKLMPAIFFIWCGGGWLGSLTCCIACTRTASFLCESFGYTSVPASRGHCRSGIGNLLLLCKDWGLSLVLVLEKTEND